MINRCKSNPCCGDQTYCTELDNYPKPEKRPGMNFVDAMNFCFAHPPDGKTIYAVSLPGEEWYVYLGGIMSARYPHVLTKRYLIRPTDFIGLPVDFKKLFFSYTPSQEDINSEEWMIVEFDEA